MKYIKTFFLFISVWVILYGVCVTFGSNPYDDFNEFVVSFFATVLSVYLYNRHFSKSQYEKGYVDGAKFGAEEAGNMYIDAIEKATAKEKL